MTRRPPRGKNATHARSRCGIEKGEAIVVTLPATASADHCSTGAPTIGFGPNCTGTDAGCWGWGMDTSDGYRCTGFDWAGCVGFSNGPYRSFQRSCSGVDLY